MAFPTAALLSGFGALVLFQFLKVTSLTALSSFVQQQKKKKKIS